jgi:hypothetical protein
MQVLKNFQDFFFSQYLPKALPYLCFSNGYSLSLQYYFAKSVLTSQPLRIIFFPDHYIFSTHFFSMWNKF